MANFVKQTDYAMVIKSTIVYTLISLVLLGGFIHSRRQTKVLAQQNQSLQRLHHTLADKNRQLAELAIRDPLTRLYNRSHLAEVIEQQIRLKHRYNSTACLVMIDIDDFKEINDNLGHKVGDDILQRFAEILSESARDSDIVARWGGEEFILLCPKTALNEAKIIAKRFQQALADKQVTTMPVITCSIGIAELDSSSSAEQWFISADNAMYRAKDRGKNTIYCVEN